MENKDQEIIAEEIETEETTSEDIETTSEQDVIETEPAVSEAADEPDVSEEETNVSEADQTDEAASEEVGETIEQPGQEISSQPEEIAEETAPAQEPVIEEPSLQEEAVMQEPEEEPVIAAEETPEEIISDESEPEIQEETEPKLAEPITVTAAQEPVIPAEPAEKSKKTGLLSNRKIWIGAALAVIAIALAFIIPAWQKSQKYKQALEKLDQREYQEAIDLFAELPEYKDADQYALYAGGMKDFYDGNLDRAKAQLDSSMEILDAPLYVSYINGVNSMSEGYFADSYEDAYQSFIGAGGILDSSDLAVYARGIADFLSDDYAAADTAFRKVVSDSAIDTEYIERSQNAVLYMDTIEKFDSGDYSVKDDFITVADNDDGLIGDTPLAYVDYIEAKELYDDGHYYKARRKFGDCFEIKDAAELYESCIQDRPSTGIIYDKNKSSAVSIIIKDNEDGEDLFVKIYNSSDKLAETLYIRDGKSGTAKIAAGRHRMALASGDGDEWYGTKDMFGSSGSYRKLLIDGDDEFYKFLNGYEYTLQFNVSEGGNVASQYTDYEGL